MTHTSDTFPSYLVSHELNAPHLLVTPESLQIEPRTYEGLLRLRDDLLDGTLVHVDVDHISTKPGVDKFNMTVFNEHCDTAHCIGGWLMTRNQLNRGDWPSRLQSLFYVWKNQFFGWDGNWDLLTPKLAAQAIENFLYGSKCPWASIVRELDGNATESDT